MTSDRWASWAVLATTLLALLLGWGLRTAVLGRTRELSDRTSGVSVAVPESWQMGTPGPGAVLSAHDPRDPHTSVVIAVLDLGEQDAALAQQTYLFGLGQTLTGFTMVDPPTPAEVGIDQAVRFSYAFVEDPAVASPLARRYPVVIVAGGTFVARAGKLYIVTTTAEATRAEQQSALLENIVRSIGLP